MVYIVFDIICEMLLLDDICIIIPGISLMMIIINTIESWKAGKLESLESWKAKYKKLESR